MKDFVSICLGKKSNTRSTATELLSHPLIKLYETVDLNYFKEWLKPLKKT